MNYTIIYSLLLIIVLLFLIVIDYRRSERIDSPGVVMGSLWLVMNVPSMIYIAFEDSYFENIVMVFNNPDVREMYVSYIGVQIVYFIFLYLGLWRKAYWGSDSFPEIAQSLDCGNVKRIMIVCLFFFSLGIIVLWRTNGGLLGIISNFGDRTKMNNSNILLQIGMSTPYILVTCACVYFHDFLDNRKSLFRLGTVVVCVVVGLMLTGGRKPFMMVIYYLFFFTILGMCRFDIRQYKKVLVFIPIVILMFMTPRVLRDRNNLTSFMSTGQISSNMFSEKGVESVGDLSYIYTYVGLVNYFNQENYYYGTTFVDLLYSFVPRKYLENKPPVDDGKYVATLFRTGKRLDHPSRLDDMYISSWPPETLGNGYMNFGIVGVSIFAFILGNIYCWFYRKLQNSTSNNRLYYLVMYPYVLFAFHLTNLRIMAFITMSLTFFCILFISKNIKFLIKN